ncbi:uncharacterized protein LOC119585996 [Penaeus monodon]|uniref:uncharacterized protein LOC119585996 n=1 Tax=Penaeus monodon TaxID=6687 RepID=UPI0018A737F0|nr:uncharacterized protein LOC119585996 [Penaeus monodon]
MSGAPLFTRLSLPEGLEEVVEGLAREVIKSQVSEPFDIYNFAWKHFSDLVSRKKDLPAKDAAPYAPPNRYRKADASGNNQYGRRGAPTGSVRVVPTVPSRRRGKSLGEDGVGKTGSLDRERPPRRSFIAETRDRMKKSVSLDRRTVPGLSRSKSSSRDKVNQSRESIVGKPRKGRKKGANNVPLGAVAGAVAAGTAAAAAGAVVAGSSADDDAPADAAEEVEAVAEAADETEPQSRQLSCCGTRPRRWRASACRQRLRRIQERMLPPMLQMMPRKRTLQQERQM